jgi:hypothetical protein
MQPLLDQLRSLETGLVPNSPKDPALYGMLRMPINCTRKADVNANVRSCHAERNLRAAEMPHRIACSACRSSTYHLFGVESGGQDPRPNRHVVPNPIQ